jgi:hypothetical protein
VIAPVSAVLTGALPGALLEGPVEILVIDHIEMPSEN